MLELNVGFFDLAKVQNFIIYLSLSENDFQ